jgi:hypothetical protein
MNLKVTTNKITRETSVTATDAKGHFLCCETWSGTGARLTAALQSHVRTSAEQLQRRHNQATASTTPETRLLAERL